MLLDRISPHWKAGCTMQVTLTIAAARERFANRFAEFRNKGLHFFKYWGYGLESRDEAVSAALFLTWRCATRLVRAGKLTDDTLTSAFYYSCKKVRSGHALRSSHFPDLFESPRFGQPPIVNGGLNLDAYASDQTPIPDLVSFRLDTPEWLDSLTPRQRARAVYLASGATTKDCAREWGITTQAVSTYRRQLNASYRRFLGLD